MVSIKNRKASGIKYLIVLPLILMCLLMFCQSALAATMGDVNSDGAINVKDVTMVQKHVLSISPGLTAAQQLLADVNGDGVINVLDVSLIMRYALGLISEFPAVSLNEVSVTAINARQIDVVFNKAVTAAAAQNPANYEVYKQGALFTNVFGTATQGAVAALQPDGKTVRLTLNDGQVLVNGSNFNRVVVKAAVGLAADYTDSSVEFLDTTAPTFVSVRSVGASTIELTFSEPVKASLLPLQGVRLSDAINPDIALDLANATFHDPSRTVTIDLAAGVLTPGATYTVSLNPEPAPPAPHNVVDYVGLKAIPSSRQFTHTPVISTPTVTATAINEKTVRLTFDRAVSRTGMAVVDNIRFRLNFNLPAAVQRDSDDMNGFGEDFEAAMVPGSGGKQYDVQFASPLSVGSYTLYIHYLDNNDLDGRIGDAYGNILPNNTSVTFNVVATTTPVIVYAKTLATDRLEITYSRNVTKNANEPTQFKLYNGGVLVGTGDDIVSNVGNVIVVDFDPTPFTTTVAYPTHEIRYVQSVTAADRVRDTATTAYALSPDKVVGIASGF